jgi:hypothetical protein
MRRLILVVCLVVSGVVLVPGTAGAAGSWRPALALVRPPAGTAAVAGEYGADGLFHGFTTERGQAQTVLYLQGTGARWARSVSPYRGLVLAAAVDGGATYVMYEPPSGGLSLGVRTAAGKYLPARGLWTLPPGDPLENRNVQLVYTGARLFVHNGHWQAFWSGWSPSVRQSAFSGAWTRSDTTRYARTLALDSTDEGFDISFFQMDADRLPDGRVAVLLAGSLDRKMSFGVSGPGGWTFSNLPWPTGQVEQEFQKTVTRPQLVSRYGRLYAVWIADDIVYTAHYDGRAWSPPLPSVGTGHDVTALRQSISLGRQFVAWSDSTGMYVAERALGGGSFVRTLLSQAGGPTLGALATNKARATVLFMVTVAPDSTELRTRQQ